MRAELQLFSRSLRRLDRGNALVIFTLFIVVLFGFAALSLDVGNVLREQRKLQVGTDAAALTGVVNLTGDMVNLSGQKDFAKNEAALMANTNGVTDTEIAAGARNGFPGEIQVGQWSGGTFVPDAAPYSAVRVPARRIVPLNFATVVGLSQMTPAVNSVAELGAMGIPYGIPTNELVAVGNNMFLHPWPLQGVGGNWGPLDMCGKLVGAPDTIAAIDGPGCFATPGEVTSTATGFDGVKQGFKQLYNDPSNPSHIVVMPITGIYPDGNKNIPILGFAVVQLLEDGSKSGANWQLEVNILGIGFSALKHFGLGPTRVLVE